MRRGYIRMTPGFDPAWLARPDGVYGQDLQWKRCVVFTESEYEDMVSRVAVAITEKNYSEEARRIVEGGD